MLYSQIRQRVSVIHVIHLSYHRMVCLYPPLTLNNGSVPRPMHRMCRFSVVQFVGVLLRPVPSVVTLFMGNGSVETLLVSSDRPATKQLVARMAVEAAKGVIHLHR